VSGTPSPAEWAGTRDDMHNLHRFGTDQRARCNPEIRTHSYTTTPERDRTREPHARLRTREEIEAGPFAGLYRFCPACAKETS
jgi:hypothetical protein